MPIKYKSTTNQMYVENQIQKFKSNAHQMASGIWSPFDGHLTHIWLAFDWYLICLVWCATPSPRSNSSNTFFFFWSWLAKTALPSESVTHLHFLRSTRLPMFPIEKTRRRFSLTILAATMSRMTGLHSRWGLPCRHTAQAKVKVRKWTIGQTGRSKSNQHRSKSKSESGQ